MGIVRSVCGYIGAVLLVLLLTKPASAQFQYLTISATPLSTFQLTTNPTPSQTLTVFTQWGWLTVDTTINVCVSMNAPLTGTGTNTDNIPQADVQVNSVSIVSGKTNCGVTGATLIGTGSISWLVPGSRTDSPAIRISGYSNTLAPDTYTGTIYLYALTF